MSTHLHSRIARLLPDRPAVREPGRITTYAELDDAANRFAGAVASRAGGDGPVALLIDPGASLFFLRVYQSADQTTLPLHQMQMMNSDRRVSPQRLHCRLIFPGERRPALFFGQVETAHNSIAAA